MSASVSISLLIVVGTLLKMLWDMPGQEYYGPADSCDCGGKYCPVSDPDPATTQR